MSNGEYVFFAFDLGATNGRSLLGGIENGKLRIKELTRFPNSFYRIQGKYWWDIYYLFEELKKGLAIGAEQSKIDAIGIDTWGVDYVFVAEDGSLLNLPRCYRDPFTDGIPDIFIRKMSKEKLYEHTGIQTLNFNSLYQLYAQQREGSFALKAATRLLFIPDALSYLLSGKMVMEYSIASTSQLLNVKTRQADNDILNVLGLNSSLLGKVIPPGQKIGPVTEDVAMECHVDNTTSVIAVGGHDTASAVVAVPAEDHHFAYLSSGTWSLMGIEIDEPILTEKAFQLNFTNEGGVGNKIRFLKNITGMWILEECRKEWKKREISYDYEEIRQLYISVPPFRYIIDPDNVAFAHPESMLNAIQEFCQSRELPVPQTDAGYIRCIFDSLALKYRYVLECLDQIAPFKIHRLHIIGGGSKNSLLNQMTANVIGRPVVAGPVEATAIGNIMVQAQSLGVVHSLQEIRKVVINSILTETFEPQSIEGVEKAYQTLLNLLNE